MGRKRLPGLILRAGVWHIDKRIGGRRVCQSTGTGDLQEAERFLARLMEETRQAQVYGVRPARTFEQAAAKFVLENQHKRSIGDDVSQLRQLVPWLGSTPLDRIHMGTFQAWIDKRRKAGQSDGHHQPWPEGGPAHSQSRRVGVGGRARADLAWCGSEAQAAAGRREEEALSAELV